MQMILIFSWQKILESVENIPKYFEKLKKATIETISLEKTIILSINTDQTLYLQ